MILTSNKFLDSVRQKAALTQGQAGLDNSKILEIATDVLVSVLVPEILDKNEYFLIHTEEISLQPGKSAVRIPPRAIGGRLLHIYLKQGDGSPQSLTPYTTEDLVYLPTAPDNNPSGFYIENNWVNLVPPVGSSPAGSLVFKYWFRPSGLVMESAGRKITAVGSNTITLPSIPAAWAVGDRLDVVSNLSGNEIRAASLEIQSLDTGTNTITFTAPITSYGIETGHWVTREHESVVPMVPEDLHPLLVELTVQKIAEIRNDDVRLRQAQSRIATLRDSTNTLLEHRVQSMPQVIVGRNPFFR